MMISLPDWLILCVWRALLGEIYPEIRAIALKMVEGRTLLIRYYMDRKVTEFDWESLEMIATNISASIGNDLNDLIGYIDIDCQFDVSALGKLDFLDGFIYCRREYDL